MNIVFVCTGNTCRSPMAEGFMNNLSADCNIPMNVTSRGVMTVPGSCVSRNSVEALKEFDIDISNHVPKNITFEDIENADLVLTMTASHCEFLKNAVPQCDAKIFSLGDYAGRGDISDPYGGGYENYKACAIEIKEAVTALLDKIKSQYE